jgi:hypothetical protein
MLCCHTSVLHKPRILWRSLLTSSKSAFVNLYALENPLNYEYSVPDHCVVEQAPCSLVCGIGPLALWSMKWLHFPSPEKIALAMEQLVRACLSFVSRTARCWFLEHQGTTTIWERAGIHSEAPFTVCLVPNWFWQICSVECFHHFHISISFITE